MSEQPEKPPYISQADWDEADLPEWTEEDFAQAKPFKEVFPGQFEAWQQKRDPGRPKVERPKKLTNFRLDPAVIHGIRATGKGYNARVERVLREALADGKLDAPRDGQRSRGSDRTSV